MTIGDRIKKLRNQIGLSQTELAIKSDSSKQTIYKYENNIVTNIPSDKIEIISEILGTTPSYLMGWENQNSNMLIELNHLTDDEKRLLTDFRTLNKQGQEYILQTMDMVKEKYKKISLSELEINKDA